MHRPPKPATPKRATSASRSSSVNRLNATTVPRSEPPRRVVLNPRRSVMPPASLSETVRSEPEPELSEIDILYDDYLLSLAAEVIMKKKVEEREKTLLHQVAALAKKKEECEYMLHAVRSRISDIKALNHFETCIKKQLEDVDKFLETHEEKIMKNLEMIYSVLESSDKLAVKDIIIPEREEDLNTLKKTLDEITEILNSMTNFFPESADGIGSISKNLTEFKNTSAEVEKQLESNIDFLIFQGA
ncbi:uncharacterized protein [Chelonus insularis]|uniref:uncharacterized protein isoform X2 n=1 Tax=Chelonus insularis TaxID=460826 RepID=UPI001588D899|nr:uncharacterized protein LOC118072041 isoform X2 [Chelonus insularis]